MNKPKSTEKKARAIFVTEDLKEVKFDDGKTAGFAYEINPGDEPVVEYIPSAALTEAEAPVKELEVNWNKWNVKEAEASRDAALALLRETHEAFNGYFTAVGDETGWQNALEPTSRNGGRGETQAVAPRFM
jgi:hypothetical protein